MLTARCLPEAGRAVRAGEPAGDAVADAVRGAVREHDRHAAVHHVQAERRALEHVQPGEVLFGEAHLLGCHVHRRCARHTLGAQPLSPPAAKLAAPHAWATLKPSADRHAIKFIKAECLSLHKHGAAGKRTLGVPRHPAARVHTAPGCPGASAGCRRRPPSTCWGGRPPPAPPPRAPPRSPWPPPRPHGPTPSGRVRRGRCGWAWRTARLRRRRS